MNDYGVTIKMIGYKRVPVSLFHRKSLTDWPAIETEPPRQPAGD